MIKRQDYRTLSRSNGRLLDFFLSVSRNLLYEKRMQKPPVAVREFKKPKEMRACPTVRFTHNAEGVLAFNCDGDLALWESESTKLLKTEHLPKGYYFPGLWMSPDRRFGAVSGEDSTYFIDTATLKVTKALPFKTHHLSWSHDGALVAAVKYISETYIYKVHVLETTERKEIAAFELPKDSNIPQFWGKTSELIFCGNSAIWTWTAQDKKFVKRAKFVDNVRHIGWSEDGKTYIYSITRKKAFLDANDWQSHSLDAPEKADHFAISPDGKRFAMTVGNTIVIWDLKENKAWLKWKRPNFGSAISVDFSPDGQQLACTPDHEVHVLDFRTGAKEQLIGLPKPKAGEIQCLNMVGPDDRMDVDGWQPINALTVKCPACNTVDLSSVTEPYALARKTESPVDMAPAAAGNLLVRDSLKRVLELAAPGQCKFYPTVHRKTRQPTAWFLAVPQHIQTTAKPKGKNCGKCGEPMDWEEDEATNNPASEKDVFKSRNLRWKEHEHFTYFSVRLETLVKKLRLRGMVRSIDCKQTPTSEDLAWVEEKFGLLQQSDAKPASKAGKDTATEWFNDYLKRNARKKPVAHDFEAAEKKLGVKLPEAYKRFMAAVGTKTFKDLDGEEEFNAHILPPKQLKLETCLERGDDEDEKFKGLLFAVTDHGDAFYFDASRGNDYEVRKHDHELESYEPYAKNFAECIKRFAGG